MVSVALAPANFLRQCGKYLQNDIMNKDEGQHLQRAGIEVIFSALYSLFNCLLTGFSHKAIVRATEESRKCIGFERK